VICNGRDIERLMSLNQFAGYPARRNVVRFVSLLVRRPRLEPALPVTLPSRGKWLVKILGRQGRYVFGLYRRDMKVIGYLGILDRLFGVPVTTRIWTTYGAIDRVLRSMNVS